jgi:hypothetical protein
MLKDKVISLTFTWAAHLDYVWKSADVWGSGGIAPHFLNIGTRWRSVVSFMPQPLHFQGKASLTSLDRRLIESQIWSRCGRKKSTHSRNETLVIQHLALTLYRMSATINVASINCRWQQFLKDMRMTMWYVWMNKVSVLRLHKHLCGRNEENHNSCWYGGNAVDLNVGVTLFKSQLIILNDVLNSFL